MANLDKTVVLVADDEPSTLALVTSHLRSRGYKVLEAVDGDQAWELAHEHLPHVVVLDVMMPGMSGWEVCRKIREAVSLAHTGVVMLTGIGENLNEMTSPLYGADAYLDKPFEFSDLDRKIKETLARRRGGAFGRPDAADVVLERRDRKSTPSAARAAEAEVTEEIDEAWDEPTLPLAHRQPPRSRPRPPAPPASVSALRKAASRAPAPAPKAAARPQAEVRKAAAPAEKKRPAKAKGKGKPKLKAKAKAKAGAKLAVAARGAASAARKAVKATVKKVRKAAPKAKGAAKPAAPGRASKLKRIKKRKP